MTEKCCEITQEIKDRIKENNVKKEYLKSYKKSCDKLRSLEEQFTELKETAFSLRSPVITDMPKAFRQHDISDMMVRLEVLFTKIIKLKEECVVRKMDIESRIADMPEGIQAQVIHKRYVEHKEWEQICVEINYSWNHTHRLHSKALNSIKID